MWVFEPAGQHVEDLVYRANVNVPCHLILQNRNAYCNTFLLAHDAAVSSTDAQLMSPHNE